MPLTRLTAIDGEAILPLAEAKASARITHNDQDAVLIGIRNAALTDIERRSGLALSASSWRWSATRLTSRVDLPIGPATSVTSITYNDAEGVEQTYGDARLVDGRVFPSASGSWPPVYDYAAVEFEAGPPPPDDLAVLIVAAQIQFQILENRGRDDQKFIEGMERAVSSVLDSLLPVLV